MKRLQSECLVCLLRHLKGLPEDISEERKLKYTQEVFKVLAFAKEENSAPFLLWKINKLKKSVLGLDNEFEEVKIKFNKIMETYADRIEKDINLSSDKLKTAIAYATLGNYIDFGALENVDPEYLDKMLSSASDMNIDEKVLSDLKSDLAKGGKLLFLTDNCGEIVLDRILIKTIKTLYPESEITALVRGENVLNDATKEDAAFVGLDREVKVLSNGTGIAGTVPEKCSPEARKAIREADIIISKGQGNFETMIGCGLNVYYMFLCKCDFFAKKFNKERFTDIFINDKDCRNLI